MITTTNTTAPTPAAAPPAPPTDAPPILNPSIFDLLPALHAQLSRTSTTTAPNNPGASTNPADAPPSIDTAPLKAHMRHALRELARLPDMARGLDEQRAEIAQWESRVAALQRVMAELGVAAAAVTTGEMKDEGGG